MKKELYELANKLKFTASIVSDVEWKHSTKEQMRHYLWMCELRWWLMSTFSVEVNILSSTVGYELYGMCREPLSYIEMDQGVFKYYTEAFETALVTALKFVKDGREKENNKK